MAVTCFILAGICLIFGILQFAEKGFCFNNAYIFTTPEERKRMNKKPHYRQSAIVFAFLCGVFVLMGLYAMLQYCWLFILAIGIAVVALIYAIVSGWKGVNNGK